jgi:hypothetical protein
MTCIDTISFGAWQYLMRISSIVIFMSLRNIKTGPIDVDLEDIQFILTDMRHRALKLLIPVPSSAILRTNFPLLVRLHLVLVLAPLNTLIISERPLP